MTEKISARNLVAERVNGRRKNIIRASIAVALKTRATGVELGVGNGEHSHIILRYARPKRLYLVDEWRVQRPGEGRLEQQAMEAMFHMVGLKTAGRNVVLIRESSEEAAYQIQERIDFVYYSARKGANEVRDDLYRWWSMIREGGVLYGDKWSAIHHGFDVQDVVKAFAQDKDVEVFVYGDPPNEQWLIERNTKEKGTGTTYVRYLNRGLTHGFELGNRK